MAPGGVIDYGLALAGAVLLAGLFLPPLRSRTRDLTATSRTGRRRVHVAAGSVAAGMWLLHARLQAASPIGWATIAALLLVVVSGAGGALVARHRRLDSWRQRYARWRAVHAALVHLLVFVGIIHVIAAHMY